MFSLTFVLSGIHRPEGQRMKRNVYWVVNICKWNLDVALPPPIHARHFQLLRGNKTPLSGQIRCVIACMTAGRKVQATLALYSRDSIDMWNCVYLASSHTEQDKIWSFLASQVVKSLLEVSLQCPHLSQRSLGCKSALTLLQPLKYGWCLQWDCISQALKRLYGDDKMHTKTCV